MEENTYTLVYNRAEGYEERVLPKKELIREVSSLLKKPKRIFLGLGDFLEIGDYNNLLDTIFFEKEDVQFENLLDNANRKISEQGNIPFSFLKLAVYFPDFLLKGVPTFCASIVGKKSRLFPGAEQFVKLIKSYEPIVMSALPFEVAIEFVKRVGLQEKNLISTEYKITTDSHKWRVYAGEVLKFLSGDRKSLEIEKYMAMHDLRDDEVVYIGRGEAGLKTFATVNSIAFNPSEAIIPESRITIYGSSLESLLVLFNFDGEYENFLMAERNEEYLPSLIVYSDVKSKSNELIELELTHRRLQNNIIGLRIEHSAESYMSVERDIDVEFGGSAINIKEVRRMVQERMEKYENNPQDFIDEISALAVEKYRNLFRE